MKIKHVKNTGQMEGQLGKLTGGQSGKIAGGGGQTGQMASKGKGSKKLPRGCIALFAP